MNFNYINTEELYIKRESNGELPDNIKVIHIHGELDNDDNKMIFGYGDEKSEESKEIEDLNNNEFFENVKSTKYTLTLNNDELKEFANMKMVRIGVFAKFEIEFEEFEIFVFGHSCGNSDRTLLRELFENDNCKKIRCFLKRIVMVQIIMKKFHEIFIEILIKKTNTEQKLLLENFL